MIEENMPKYIYSPTSNSHTIQTCPICLESLENIYVRTLSCDTNRLSKDNQNGIVHTFCSECIEKWFLMKSNVINNKSCPMCKSVLIWNFKYKHTREINANYLLSLAKENEDGCVEDLSLIHI